MGGKIPDAAFETDRLALNRLQKEGIAIPDGILLEQRNPQVQHFTEDQNLILNRIFIIFNNIIPHRTHAGLQLPEQKPQTRLQRQANQRQSLHPGRGKVQKRPECRRNDLLAAPNRTPHDRGAQRPDGTGPPASGAAERTATGPSEDPEDQRRSESASAGG